MIASNNGVIVPPANGSIVGRVAIYLSVPSRAVPSILNWDAPTGRYQYLNGRYDDGSAAGTACACDRSGPASWCPASYACYPALQRWYLYLGQADSVLYGSLTFNTANLVPGSTATTVAWGSRWARPIATQPLPVPTSSKRNGCSRPQTTLRRPATVSTLLLPDHFGRQLAPLPALQAAAMSTTSLHIGTIVLDNDFRHPVALAKDAATLHLTTDGRFELGIGTGRPDAAREAELFGQPWGSAGERLRRLVETVTHVREQVRPVPRVAQALAASRSLRAGHFLGRPGWWPGRPSRHRCPPRRARQRSQC